MPLDYKQYQVEVIADIAKVLGDAECQPILFVGSGFSKRYANGPSWEELLTALAEKCPLIDKDFAYYKQTYDGDLKKIGTTPYATAASTPTVCVLTAVKIHCATNTAIAAPMKWSGTNTKTSTHPTMPNSLSSRTML